MISDNLIEIRKNINDAELVAVTKSRSITDIQRVLYEDVKIIAENKVQEAMDKYPRIRDLLIENNAEFHMIGHLQTNKVKRAVEIFDMIQSVDSLKIAKEISRHAVKADKIQQVLIQINIGDESKKSGVAYEEALTLFQNIRDFPNMLVKGLMCIAPFYSDPEKTRPYFKKMKQLFDKTGLSILSMGMSHDYKIAIEEGANMVRIGSAIFGTY